MQIANSKIIYPELSYKITGMLFTIHNELGRYCNEKQYCDAIESSFKNGKMDYVREFVLPPSFNGEKQGRNKVDFLIDNKIVLEVKAKPITTREDYSQLKRYLVAINKKLGILVNFRRQYLQPKRILNSQASE